MTPAVINILGQIGSATTDRYTALEQAQEHADRTQTPCGVWDRGAVFVASEIPPDFDDFDTREADGWSLHAVVDPWTWAED